MAHQNKERECLARLTEERQLLRLRGERLRRLGAAGEGRLVLTVVLTAAGAQSLAVAAVGKRAAGKSALLSALIQRLSNNIVAGGLLSARPSDHDYLFTHAACERYYAPQSTDKDLVIVTHALPQLASLSFLDTVSNTPVSRSTDSTTPAATTAPASSEEAFGLKSLRFTDPAIRAIKVPEGARTSVPNTPRALSLPDRLMSAGVDVVLFTIRHSDVDSFTLESPTTSKLLRNATLPVLVITGVDAVWDSIRARSRTDNSLNDDFVRWREACRRTLTARVAVVIGPDIAVPQFYVSSERDASWKGLNDMSLLVDLLSTLGNDVSRRTALQSLTATRRLGASTADYASTVRGILGNLSNSKAFLHSTITDLKDRVASISRRKWEWESAVIAAFEDSLTDLGLDRPMPSQDTTTDPVELARRSELFDNPPDIDAIKRTYSAAATTSSFAALRLVHLAAQANDHSLARRMLITAAANDHSRAASILARSLESSSSSSSERWHTRAAAAGDPSSILALARLAIRDNDIPAAISRLRSAPVDDADVLMLLADCLLMNKKKGGEFERGEEAKSLCERAERALNARVARVLKLGLTLFNTNRLRTGYAVNAFLERFRENLTSRTASLRRAATSISTSAVASTGMAEKVFMRTVGEEVESIVAAWCAGLIDAVDDDVDEHDRDEEEYGDEGVSGGGGRWLVAALMKVISAATPGNVSVSAVARTVVVAHVVGMMDVGGDGGDAGRRMGNVVVGEGASPLARMLLAAVGGNDNDGGDEKTGGLEEECVTALRRFIGGGWSVTCARLVEAVEGCLGVVDHALDSEIGVFAGRVAWADEVVRDAERDVRDAWAGVVRDACDGAIREARAAVAEVSVPEKVVSVGGDRAPVGVQVVEAPRPASEFGIVEDVGSVDAVLDFNLMPFVWEGSTVIMATQIFEEVSGSIALNSWDWDDVRYPMKSMGNAARIDALLESAAAAFNDNPSSPSSMSQWDQALSLSMSAGDLISAANALSNMGIAARAPQQNQQQGNLKTSAKHLTSAWQKTVQHILHSSSLGGSDPGMVIVMDSLGAELTLNGFPERPTGARLSSGISPATVCWIARLIISLGTTCLLTGDAATADMWYVAAIRLCDNTLARLPKWSTPGVGTGRPKSQLMITARALLLAKVRAATCRGYASPTSGSLADAIEILNSNADLFATPTSTTNLSTTPAGVEIADTKTSSRCMADMESVMGDICHARGDIPDAIAHHARSAMLHLANDDKPSHARELANLGALWCEVGRCLRGCEVLFRSHGGVVGDAVRGVKRVPSIGGGVKRRAVVAADASVPGRVFRVAIARDAVDGDLDVALRVGDRVRVAMVMDDGVTALGQKVQGGLQGTFPLGCLEVEERVEAQVQPRDPVVGSAPGSYGALLDALKGVPLVGGDGSASGSVEGHCGMPYVELGLGMLREVAALGFGTDEAVINIAVCEIMLNQPYRAMASLTLLLATHPTRATPIPVPLQKHACMVLASSVLMIALANESGAGSGDGETFLDREMVDFGLLNRLIEVVGVDDVVVVETGGFVRDMAVPFLLAAEKSSGSVGGQDGVGRAFMDGFYVGANIRAGIEITARAVRGCVDLIEVLAPAAGEASAARFVGGACALVKSVAVLASRAGVSVGGGGSGLENVRGDAGVFNMAASILRIEAAVGRAGSIAAAASPARTPTFAEVAVWAWAASNARLSVCAICAPDALSFVSAAAVGGVGGSGGSEEVFPCKHLRKSKSTPSVAVSASSVKPEKAVAAPLMPRNEKGGRIMAEAADEVFGAMVRRVTKHQKSVSGTTGPTNTKRSSIAKTPWNPPRPRTIYFPPLSKGGSDDEDYEDSLVETLKDVLKSLDGDEPSSRSLLQKQQQQRVAKTRVLGGGGVGGLRTTKSGGGGGAESFIDMFYRDAADAVKRSSERRSVVGEAGRGNDSLPLYSD